MLLERLHLDAANVVIDSFHLEAEAGREVFLVPDHDIDVLRAISRFTSWAFSCPPIAFHSEGTVIQVIAHDRAVLLGRLAGFDGEFGGRFAEGRKDSPGVKPACSLFSENIIPVEVTRFHLARRGVGPVGAAHRTANSVAPFGEVEPVADLAPDSVVFFPVDEAGCRPRPGG